MKRYVQKALPAAKKIAKLIAQQTIGRLPPPAARLTGKLAKDGGTPVRNTRYRPWPANRPGLVLGRVLSGRSHLWQVLTSGVEGLPQPLAKRFAERWAAYCQCRFALMLPHGTDALRLALAAALDHDGLDYGGEVIVPNLSFIASATAPLDRRFGVVFVDVDPVTLCLDPAKVEAAIVPGKTRAIMAVHLFGQPADMSGLQLIARKHGLKLIEDAAQAHGAEWDGQPAGALGDAAGFSFQSSKNLSSGEGGALTTSDEAVFERAYQMHDAGRARVGGERWGHQTLGWNCRISEFQAAILLDRLVTFETEQEHRRERFRALQERLEEVACVEVVGTHPRVNKHGAYMFPIRYKAEQCDGLGIDDFLRATGAEGVPAYRGYACTMAQQPAMVQLQEKRPEYLRRLSTPVADQAVKELIYIGHSVLLSGDKDMAEIAAAFRKIQRHYAPHATRAKASRAAAPAATGLAIVAPAGEAIKPLRVGVIGVGVMGRSHAAALVAHRHTQLVAVTDAQAVARKVAADFRCRWFDTPEQMIASGEVDTVVIATPHWQHAALSIAALEAGLHVICEKPLTVTASQADAVLAAAIRSKGLFVVVHQNRFEPSYQQAKKLLATGELGQIVRASFVESFWRTQAYYQSGGWRGTWKGEGGGVLLNQAPHLLDRYTWLCGMPETVGSRCDTTLHRIEVEDCASAVFRHSNGAHGYLHVSTNECPAISQVTICCDRGRIQIDSGVLRVTRLRDSIRDRTLNDAQLMGDIPGETKEFGGSLVGGIPELLGLFYDNVAAAAVGRAELVCPGAAALQPVELANAMLLSSHTGREIRLPLNRADYDAFMREKTGADIPASAE